MDTIEGRCFDSELQGTIGAIQREQPLKEQPENKEEPSHHVYKDFEAQLYVEIKCQLDATDVFIADLIACSTCFGHHYAHQLRVMCPVCRMLQSSILQTGHITLSSTPDQQLENHSTKYHRKQPLYNTLELLMMGIVVPETC